MKIEAVNITQIIEEISSERFGQSFAVCCLKNGIGGIEIDGVFHENISNSILFLDSKHNWKIFKE